MTYNKKSRSKLVHGWLILLQRSFEFLLKPPTQQTFPHLSLARIKSQPPFLNGPLAFITRMALETNQDTSFGVGRPASPEGHDCLLL